MNAMRWIALLMLVSFLINLRMVGAQIEAAFYSPASRFWELLAGTTLAAVLKPRRCIDAPVSPTPSPTHRSYPLYLWHWPLLSFAHIEPGSLARW